ncbi:MAG TPA: lipocalin-like domain-containing protein [Myxococcota bacterium]|nr:lipocalin-like domain-containing protein [Myxococcota bacterium]
MGDDASRHPLCGSWKLVSFELRLPNGEVSYPFGRAPRGYVFYNEQGFMSAAFMGADRVKPQSADLADTSKTVNYDQFNAYCGRFEVKGERVIHHVEVASLPQWCGIDQERVFKIDGTRLILETPPLTINAQAPTAYLIWERV